MIDTETIVPIGFDKVETIVHMADIHIRLTQRHTEYREAFDKMYAHIKTLGEKTIILVAGDIFHGKVDLSPEAVLLASEFLKNLADIRPVILIAGNHDCLLTNNTRLDSLTPVVDALNHKNLHYLKKTGIYGVGNILFNNMAVFDDVTKFLDIKKITKKLNNRYDTKIALFHGAIHGSLTDIGYLIENKASTPDRFDGHDLVLLGDIHKMQTFYIDNVVSLEDAEAFSKTPESNDWEVIDDDTLVDRVRLRKKSSPIFRYSGSTIQQNHGETLKNHGFSVWDVAKRTYEHVEIPNDYGYFTIDIVNGELKTDITDMPPKPKLRVRCKESVATEVKKIIAKIRETKTITDLVYMRVDGDVDPNTTVSKTDATIGQISSVDYQNSLIESFLKEKYSEVMDDATLEAVKKINKETNATLPTDDQSKNIRWKPVKFEFSNMFSYGEGNVIDFTTMDGVYGLFAANASGKSSIADAICFTVFDKSARAFKASHVINSQKMSFSGKFVFEINGVQYTIERSGQRDKKNNVKVEVNFFKTINGENIPLNSEARRATNDVIRDYLGTYDDFVLTSLALQNNQGSFIDIGQTGRKELLSQFIGLNLFDSLYAKASDRIKELNGAIKMFNKDDGYSKISEMESALSILDGKMIETEKKKEVISISKVEMEKEIEGLKSQLVKIDAPQSDIDTLKARRASISDTISKKTEDIKSIDEGIIAGKKMLAEKMKSIEGVDVESMKKSNQIFSEVKIEIASINASLNNLKTIVSNKIAKIKHLETHEYDPNCKFCCNNVFVKDAKEAQESLQLDKETVIRLREELLEKTNTQKELEATVEKFVSYNKTLSEIEKIKSKLTEVELRKSNGLREIERFNTSLATTNAQIEFYEKSKETIESNRKIEAKIASLTVPLRNIVAQLKAVSAEYVESYSKKVSFTDQIEVLKQRIKKIEESENDLASYEYYLTAIGKDGVPYRIMSTAVPKIEHEVNNILSQVVEFTLSLETDGKNVNAYIKYEDRKWPLELGSGMEKFISALALRVALINVSALPRANMLFVDEGFSALDSGNMAMMHALLDYLKSKFDFIIVVSHLDAMRDMVETQIEIKKVDGFSQIKHE